MRSPAKLIPVILCGGSGERLRPLSRPERPKQFLRILSDHSLLQETALRALRVSTTAAEEIVTVTLAALRSYVLSDYREIAAGLENHIISEAVPRNTAAAIANAALYIQEQFGAEAMMWVMPSDHYIGDEAALARALSQAIRAARRQHLVTFGIKPSRADENYGYVRAQDSMSGGDAFFADEFVEKPSAYIADQYIRSGGYYWNSGMFVFTAETAIEAFERYAPDLLRAVAQHDYASIQSIAFDRAILEKSENIAVVASDFKWSDVGSWESLWDIGVRQKRA
ncbi:MAG: mannose-1-phosphate guanylyltransferase [Alphaproteobacteria bacterium]